MTEKKKTKKPTLKDFLNDYCEQAPDTFAADDVLKALESPALDAKWKTMKGFPKGISDKTVRQALDSNEHVFVSPDSTVVKRAAFFKDVPFLIVPSKDEIEQGYLIPGSRFEPFHNSDVYPWECTLAAAGEAGLSKHVVEKELQHIKGAYELLSKDTFIYTICADHSENEERFDLDRRDKVGEKTLLRLTVFDLSGFYKDHSFTQGDGIICKTTDWAKGIFSIDCLAKKELTERSKKKPDGKEALKAGFERLFAQHGIEISLEQQLALAVFYAGADNLKSAALPIQIDEFIRRSKKVFLVQFGMESKFWKSKDLASAIDEAFPEADSSDDIIDKALKENECFFRSSTIYAFMLNELYEHKGVVNNKNYIAVIEKLFVGNALQYKLGQDAAEFAAAVKNMWDEACSDYDYIADEESGPVRRIIVEAISAFYKCIVSFLDQHDEASQIQTITLIMQILNVVYDILEELNDPAITDDEFLEEVNENIGLLTNQLREISAALPTEAPAEKAAPAAARFVYTFRIALRDIKPQIWRSFRVPGNVTLAELHTVIQFVMGWSFSHLHSFTIASVEYGSSETFNDYECGSDENKYTLEDLELCKGQKFDYAYDFGDGWEHAITVSSIEAYTPEKAEPCCLKGKRNCPPEDSGGPWSYPDLLEQLKRGPTGNEEEDFGIDYERLEDFDPEEFDIDAINALLLDRPHWPTGRI
ncbi:plasmid pRiA4b ORF-3 family protein [Breznakiellaceae bacterium SP9]